MKSNFTKKLMGILLVLVMMLQIVPGFLTAHAAWEDGMECWHCSHYHWDEYCCGICGACSIDCTNVTCFTETHCLECGNCYASYEECSFGYEHCEECCIICEQCEECLYEDGIELCDDCGLCVFCCRDNANAEGCECGEYCIENPEWYEHLCPDCGSAYCTVEMCELCELCLDCCEGNSECSDTPPLCVEDGDYDAHFCEDCGECFHNTDVCSGCESEGLLLCDSCCEARLEAEGCDCDDRCISDSDIEEHIENEHSNAGPHSATPQSSFDMDETHHWRPCRFCSETTHITNKTKHTFDNYGICTVCGFDSQQVILILKQPSSTVAKVSDIQTADEDDPYHPFNNKRTLSVAAKGTTELKYQWYVTYDGGEKWIEIKDDTDAESYAYIVGAKTNSITFSVPSDGCAYPPAYKCVITDENGNSVTTNVAYVKVVHLYWEYQAHKGELIGIINQPNNKDNIGMYGSDGHYVTCVGEECDDYILAPHSFGKDTKLIFDSKTGIGWHERTCIYCGFKNYLENHAHYFYDPETYECEIDFTYKNENQHKLICRFTGCKQTHLESHDYLGWQNHGTPYSNTDGIGIAYKECQICGYSSEKKLQTYDEKKGEMVDAQWTKNNDLVYVENGFASSDVVGSGTKLVIGFAPSEYDREEHLDIKYPKVAKWVVTYYCDRGSEGSKIEMDVTKDVEFEKVENELKWIVTVPSFTARAGGGILTFTPVLEECKHNGNTRVKNAVEAICTQDGYTGDTVCADCDGVICYGEVIESAGKHEGKLTLIPGTSKQGSCEERGYEGTYRCDHCNKTVRGKVTSKVHNAKTVTKNEVKPTCTEFGYSGDIYCECGVLLKEGKTLAPRHSDLTCDDCGYSWGSDSPTIRALAFNIDVPVIGNKPDYTKFDGSAYYSDGTGTYEKNGVQWFDVTENKRFVPGGVGQEFKEGHVYKVTINFRSKVGYDFAEEGVLSGTINGKEATVEYSSYGDAAGISYTFASLEHKHDMERIDKIPPTCTENGKQTYYHCKSCDKYYEDAAGAKEITDLAKWGNVTALGHAESELKSNSTHHFKVCTRCYREIAGSKTEHSGGTATCQEKAKCETCGAAYGSYAEHNLATEVWGFIDPTGHAHMCLTENCYHRGEVEQHRSSGAATEDTDEVCLDCGYVITLSENHKHAPADGIQFDDKCHWYVCGCGEIINKSAHKDADGNGLCDTCDSEVTSDKGDGGKKNEKNCDFGFVWIIVAAVLLVAGAVTAYVIVKKHSGKGNSDNV